MRPMHEIINIKMHFVNFETYYKYSQISLRVFLEYRISAVGYSFFFACNSNRLIYVVS